MKKRLINGLLLGADSLALLVTLMANAAADNPHVVSRQVGQSTCSICHNSQPILKDDNILISKNLPTDLSRFSQDGVAMCAGCHDPTAYHKVPVDIDFPLPADLPLNADKQMICLTCHYAHGKLESDKPQASFSFLDRLMDAERLRKSYLLRRNNSDGELCLICHDDTNQGPK